MPLGDKASTHQKALDLFLTKVGMPLANVVAPMVSPAACKCNVMVTTVVGRL